MEETDHLPIIIDLDDPMSRGARVTAVLIGLFLLALVIAPFVMRDTESTSAETPPTRYKTATNPPVCRPAIEVRELLEPVGHLTAPPWMPLCDWTYTPRVPSPRVP